MNNQEMKNEVIPTPLAQAVIPSVERGIFDAHTLLSSRPTNLAVQGACNAPLRARLSVAK